jgi:hypothetical protein
VERWREVVETDDAPDAEEPPEPEFVAGRARRPRRRAAVSEPPTRDNDEQPTQETTAVGAFAEGGSDDDELHDWGFDDDPADYSAAV